MFGIHAKGELIKLEETFGCVYQNRCTGYHQCGNRHDILKFVLAASYQPILTRNNVRDLMRRARGDLGRGFLGVGQTKSELCATQCRFRVTQGLLIRVIASTGKNHFGSLFRR